MKVEVEIEDLETIVFATAAIKTIETALQQRKQDPFVKPYLDFTNAHNNLVAAMNGARRAEADTATKWDGQLTKNELYLLGEFAATLTAGNEIKFDGEYRLKTPEVGTLMAKGCIRVGQGVVGVVWPGDKQASIKPISYYLVDVTKRGQDKLEQARHAAKS